MRKTIHLTVALSSRFSTMASRRPPISAIKMCPPPPSKVFRSETTVVLQNDTRSYCNPIVDKSSYAGDTSNKTDVNKIEIISDNQTGAIVAKNEIKLFPVSQENDSTKGTPKLHVKSNIVPPMICPDESMHTASSSLPCVSIADTLTKFTTLSSTSSAYTSDRLVFKRDCSAEYIQKTQSDTSSDHSLDHLGDSNSPESKDLTYVSNPPKDDILVASNRSAPSSSEAQHQDVGRSSHTILDNKSGGLLSKWKPVIKHKQILPGELLEKVTTIKHLGYVKNEKVIINQNMKLDEDCLIPKLGGKRDVNTIDIKSSNITDRKSRTPRDTVKDIAQITKATRKQMSENKSGTLKDLYKSHRPSDKNKTETPKDLKSSLKPNASINGRHGRSETQIATTKRMIPLQTEISNQSINDGVKTKRRRQKEDKSGTKVKQKYSESEISASASRNKKTSVEKCTLSLSRVHTNVEEGHYSTRSHGKGIVKKTNTKTRNTNENALPISSSDNNNSQLPADETKQEKMSRRSDGEKKMKDKQAQDKGNNKTSTENNSFQSNVGLPQTNERKSDVDNGTENCISKISLDVLLKTPTKKETAVYDLSKLFSGSLDEKYERWKKKENRNAKKREKSDQSGEDRKEKRKRPNYFVSIQITNPEIIKGIATVQNCMCKANEHLKSAMVPLATLHLTLRVGCLENQEHISRMSKALDDCVNRFNKENDAAILMNVEEIGHFGSDVVFSQVQQDDGHLKLTRLSEILEECCQCYDVPPTDRKGFTPHITIAKLSKARFRNKDKVKKKLEPSLYAEFKKHHFGRQLVTSLQLCSMQKPKDKAGYYHVSHVTQTLHYRHFSTRSEETDNITDFAHIIVATSISKAVQILKQEISRENIVNIG